MKLELIAVTLFVMFVFALPVFAQTPQIPEAQDFGELIESIFGWALALVGAAVFVNFLWAGFLWFAAAGRPGPINQAKEKMTNALIGAIILLASFLILKTINPDLVKQTFTLEGIQQPEGPPPGQPPPGQPPGQPPPGQPPGSVTRYTPRVPLHQMTIKNGYIVYGGFGPLRGINPNGTDVNLAATTWGREGLGQALFVNGQPWLASSIHNPQTDETFTVIRPWGKTDSIAIRPGGSGLSVMHNGSNFIVAVNSDRGQLTVFTVPGNSPLQNLSDGSVETATPSSNWSPSQPDGWFPKLSPDGRYVIYGSRGVWIADLRTRQEFRFTQHEGERSCLNGTWIRPDTATFVCEIGEKTARRYEVRVGEWIERPTQDDISLAAGNIFVAADEHWASYLTAGGRIAKDNRVLATNVGGALSISQDRVVYACNKNNTQICFLWAPPASE